MSTVKSWKLALAGVVALSGATAGNTKVIALNASASTLAGREGSSEHMLGQPNTFIDYVKSGYVVPGLAAAHAYGYDARQDLRSGMESFRERLNAGAAWLAHDIGTGDSRPSTGSKRAAGIRETDTGMILLTIGTLVTYQLRRKQRLLRQSPFAA
ncbi:MAG: hypothetical protein JWL65_928 [Gammaproteobacteria bacterium]|nr:hypothetical protein [Gammaproteobacteria bacterium]